MTNQKPDPFEDDDVDSDPTWQIHDEEEYKVSENAKFREWLATLFMHFVPELSTWEADFLSSIEELLDMDLDLSDSQAAKLSEIYRRYCNDDNI